jgi:uncharacterized alkaline shock family protein YloU
MDGKKNHAAGSIKISTDVILKIAETAAAEIDGVALEGQRLATKGGAMSKFMGGAVRAKLSDENAAIKLDISVLEGYNAVTVSENIQKNVKSAVQSMTGLTVTKVDVCVSGVKFKAEKPAQAAAAEQ